MSRYFSQAELNRIAAEVDEELDRRAYEAREAAQIAQIERAMNDPVLRKQIDNHPMVKALRQRPASPRWGGTAPQQSAQRPTVQRPQPGTLPTVIDQNQRFHASHLKMKPATSQVQSVVDPKVHSPSGKPKSSPPPVRYGPGGPAIPPNGFWVL
jgi:hypothetical protein